MNLVCRNDYKIAKGVCRFLSSNRKNHYDVLNLPRNCTDQEIKKAFIKLSKKFHPDVNNSPDAHQQYVQIVEAYNVLGKSNSRLMYDNTVEVPTYTYHPPSYRNHENIHYHRPEDEFNFKHRRYDETNPYYGVDGYDKMPNGNVVFIVLGIVFSGICLQLMIIRESFRIGSSRRKRQAESNAEVYEAVRANAHLGKEMQIERFKRIANGTALSEDFSKPAVNIDT